MFSTLRHEGSGGYIVQSSSAPFRIKNQGKMVLRACDRCRSKKMRCTGEADGCRRCKDRSAQCFYAKSSRSKSSPKMRSQDDESKTPVSTPIPQQMPNLDTSGSVLETDMSDTAAPLGLLDMDTEFVAGEMFDLGPEFSENSIFDTASQDIVDFGAVFSGNSHFDDTSPHGTSSDSGLDSSFSDPLRSVPHSRDFGNLEINDSSRCPCTELLRTYEKVEVYLVWGPRDRAAAIALGPEEMLQCQKDIMSSCELVLNCDTCSLKPEQAMLMISIFGKVRVSILAMRNGSPTRPPDDGQKNDYSSYSNRQKQSASAGNSISVPPDRMLSSFALEASDWNMDDEDKMHIFNCLLNIRATRLNDLISRLGNIAAQNNWLIHRNILKNSLHCII